MRRGVRLLMMMWGLTALVILPVTAARTVARSERHGIGPGEDRTLAPYFFVQSDDPDTDRLPLKSTQADIHIAGIIADITVTQVYRNEGQNTLEAIYIFPASTRAAVHAMRMTVGERVIEAEIMERAKARDTYERAKQEGQTASLLEQQRPNVFQMNVANILPGDEIQVELKYTEWIEPTDRVYEFVYPAVVGPRYSTTPAGGAPDTEKWVENPYLHSGEAPPYHFGLSVGIQTGMPISQITSPSHDVSIEYLDEARARVTLKEDEKAGAKDFVLRYKLAAGRIHSGVLLYPGRHENFFLLMVEPPERVESQAVVPREYIFIVDVSGSMNGFPIEVAKSLMEDIISGLRPTDFMNVLVFAGGSSVLSEGPSLPATEGNKKRAIAWINSHQGGGGTNLLPALNRALDLPRAEGVSRIVTVVTDGYISVEPQAFELIRNRLGQANLFAFGIGSSVNRHLIEGMARVGQGEPFVVLNQREAREQAARFGRYIASPVLTDIKVTFQGLKVHDVEPVAVPDLFALRPVMVFGKYEGVPSGEVVVSGQSASGDFRKVMPINEALVSQDNGALRLLWARSRIMRLSDLNRLRTDDDRVKEVTALGLKYSLMTQYTSFVAVDKVKRGDGEVVTVKQPLPLPSGVSDLAVGGPSVLAAVPMKMGSKSMAPAEEQMTFAPPLKEGLPGRPGPDRPGKDEEKDKTRKGTVEVTVEEVRGDLSKSVVKKALEGHSEALASCYQNALCERPQDRGEIIYHILIDAVGRVKEVRVVTSAARDASLIDCLKEEIRRIRFPQPRSGTVEVTLKVACTPAT